MSKKGAVVGINGCVDSSVALALSVKAIGKKRVMGVMMQEKDSSSDKFSLARKLDMTQQQVQQVIDDINRTIVTTRYLRMLPH